jgi:hypothetical protein
MDRRTFLGTGGLGLAAALGGQGGPRVLAAPTASSRIKDENARPGTTDWLLTNTRVDPQTKYRCPWIEGYASRTSVSAGETIELKISTDLPAKFTIDLYRLGYYGGKGGRFLERFGPLDGQPQPDPPSGEVRLRECT